MLTTFSLRKLTPLAQGKGQTYRFGLTKTTSRSCDNIYAETLEELAKTCVTTKMSIAETDDVEAFSLSPRRIFPPHHGAYIMSQPSPEELALFLREYHQNNYD